MLATLKPSLALLFAMLIDSVLSSCEPEDSCRRHCNSNYQWICSPRGSSCSCVQDVCVDFKVNFPTCQLMCGHENVVVYDRNNPIQNWCRCQEKKQISRCCRGSCISNCGEDLELREKCRNSADSNRLFSLLFPIVVAVIVVVVVVPNL